ncbi:MAG: ABC transporter permease, partial [Ardenticatenaceae bacterium]
MSIIFRLSLQQLGGKRRLALVLLLAALPMLLSALITAFDDNSNREEFVDFLLNGMIVAAILPIVTMALATAAFSNELEDRTLGYLVLKPISRWNIVLPKLVAVIVICAPLLVISAVVSTLIG